MRCLFLPGDKGRWRLIFNEFEAPILAGSCQQLAGQYRLKVEDLPEPLQTYWRGRIAEDQDVEDLREEQHQLEEERLAWRSERLPLVEKWLAAYIESGLGKPWVLELQREELENLLIIINDRKLTLGLEHGLDRALVDADFNDISDNILRLALQEVCILDQIEDRCLAAIASAENSGQQEGI